MDTKLADRLERISAELAQLADSLRGSNEPVVFPEEAANKLAQRICLQCGKTGGDRYIRGLCPADHQLTLGRVKTGDANERQLISLGLLAPRSSGGRKPRKAARLDELLAADDKYSEANARKTAHKAVLKALQLSERAKRKRQKK